MSYHAPEPGSLKRKRARRRQRPVVPARLQFTDALAHDSAEISASLFDALRPPKDASEDKKVFHVGIRAAAAPSRWTIVACRNTTKLDDGRNAGLVKVSARSTCAVALANALGLAFTKGPPPQIQIEITYTIPVPLDAIHVSIDADELLKHDQVQKKYAGGFLKKKRSLKNLNARSDATNDLVRSPESLRVLVRASLSEGSMARTNGIISLALPTHPVTHAPPPSATITHCEPVAQGYLHKTTRVVVLTSGNGSASKPKTLTASVAPSSVTTPLSEVDEDTSNEAFYTAAEDGEVASVSDQQDKPVSDLEDTEDDTEDDNLSDDPEDMISLTSPALGSHASGMLSAMTAATPRAFGRVMSGIHTPGSVFSSMTSATLRGGHAARSKVLKAQGLVRRIPDDHLHPRPVIYEDEEARAYVETSLLARLNCFSGDWVELVEAADPALTGIASLAMSSFARDDEQEPTKARAVRIYGLPEFMSAKVSTKYHIQTRGRSDSFSSSIVNTNTPTVYLSPILLANLQDPSFLRLTPMRAPESAIVGRPPGKMSSTTLPPIAREVNLLKVQSPLSTEKALDQSIFSGLVTYFESKQRLVMTGDLIAIAIDENLGRAIQEDHTTEGTTSVQLLDLIGPAGSQPKTKSSPTSVVWFQIGTVTGAGNEDQDVSDIWNGLVSMVPLKTKIHQSGAERRSVPRMLSSTWPFYQGVQAIPKAQDARMPGLIKANVQPISELRRRLRELIATYTSPRAIHSGIPPAAILIHSTQRHIGKSYTAQQACLDLGMHCFVINAFDILTAAAAGGGDNNTLGLFESRIDRAVQCGPEFTCLVIQHVEALDSARIHTSLKERVKEFRLLIATTTELDKVPENLRAIFTHEMELSAPDEGEREALLRSVISTSSMSLSPSVDLSGIAVKTAALVAGDLVEVVDRAIVARTRRREALVEQASAATSDMITLHDIDVAGGDFTVNLVPADFDIAVDEARKNFADAIGAPKIPNVQWSDVGGLANVKEAVMETIQLPLSRPELFAKGLKKRSGILFYGPPGTGKTLFAKAIATEFSLNFFSVKGPELLNMYIGESEANVRRVFQRARDARPCVVFFDELDSVAPKRGNQGDSGGVMDRIVSQLLAELDGMSDGDEDGGGAGVFVIGATNRPDLLDQALLRPGRFDKMLYLGVSDTHEKQLRILEALTRKFTLDPDLKLSSIADQLPFTYTGADLYALCSDAMLKAVTRSARVVDHRVATINANRPPSLPRLTVAQYFDHHATDADLDVLVTEQDFLQAKSELVPSVSAEELGHYERVRRDFEGDRSKKAPQPAVANGKPSIQDMQAFQALKIQELMSKGFQDGSLARNDPKGKKVAPSATPTIQDLQAFQAMKIQELMAQSLTDGSLARNDPRATATANGNGSRTSSPLLDVSEPSTGAENDDGVVRTGGPRRAVSDEGGGAGVKHRESRLFARDPGKGKSRKESKGKRAMSIFSSHSSGRGKGKGKEVEREGFGDAADDAGLYE